MSEQQPEDSNRVRIGERGGQFMMQVGPVVIHMPPAASRKLGEAIIKKSDQILRATMSKGQGIVTMTEDQLKRMGINAKRT